MLIHLIIKFKHIFYYIENVQLKMSESFSGSNNITEKTEKEVYLKFANQMFLENWDDIETFKKNKKHIGEFTMVNIFLIAITNDCIKIRDYLFIPKGFTDSMLLLRISRIIYQEEISNISIFESETKIYKLLIYTNSLRNPAVNDNEIMKKILKRRDKYPKVYNFLIKDPRVFWTLSDDLANIVELRRKWYYSRSWQWDSLRRELASVVFGSRKQIKNESSVKTQPLI